MVVDGEDSNKFALDSFSKLVRRPTIFVWERL